MEPTPSHAADPRPAPAELIVQNGRLRGEARPLHQACTLVGRAAGCDIRLNASGVCPLHCALVHSPEGLLLRELQGNTTRVNGHPGGNRHLADGDLLIVGPFQFQVRFNQLPAVASSSDEGQTAAEKEALRIQAAAVAAQQAALTEEEARLQQRRTSLEQQEEQLANHLEEKRKRLLELRDQAREAHGQLRQERKLREAQLADGKGELLALRREVEDGRTQLRLDRHRVIGLRRRLRQRWHRHWAGERAAMHRREEQLVARQHELEAEAERLRQEREAQRQARLAYNAEMEIGRRQLHAAWDKLRQGRRAEDDRQALAEIDVSDRLAALDRRESAVAEAERNLGEEMRHWQEVRQELEKENEGLENRIRNYRHKIYDHEDELKRLAELLGTLMARVEQQAAESPKTEVATESATAEQEPGTEGKAAEPQPDKPMTLPAVSLARQLNACAPPAIPVARVAPEGLPPDAAAGMEALERLAGELADQRLHLMEQCVKLVEAQRRWQQNREAAAVDLEVLGRRLHDRELAILGREETLESAEGRVRQQQRDATNLQRYLEGWQTRMTARETAWEADRERLLAEVQGREKLAEQRLQAIDKLHQRWVRRRGREIEWLKSERAACEKLRRECALMRDGWLKRQVALEQEQRSVAEKTLALEQLQQETLGQSADAAAAGKRLERLRRRWAALSAAAEKGLAEQWQKLQAEAARLEAQHARLQKHTAKVTAQETDLSQRLSEWERNQLVAADEMNSLRQDLDSSQSHRDRYEKQVNELRDEVEQLARLFLDESEPIRLPKAA